MKLDLNRGDDVPESQSDSPRAQSNASRALILLGWAMLGTVVGVGGGYFAYVKKPPVFESSATIQVSRASGPQSESPNPLSPEIDDRTVILSAPVISRALALGKQEPAIQAIIAKRGLRMDTPIVTSTGTTYEVHARGKTPRSSQQTTEAIVTAYRDYVMGDASGETSESPLAIMQELQRIQTERVPQLEQQLKELDIPRGASLQNDSVVSAAAERLQQLRPRINALESQQFALQTQMQRAESLIAESAPVGAVLSALGHAASSLERTPQPRRESVVAMEPNLGQAETDAAQRETQEQFLAQKQERERMTREIQRELKPLQFELDNLLKKFGSAHPTVQGVQAKIDRVRLKLDALPPLGDAPGDPVASGGDDENPFGTMKPPTVDFDRDAERDINASDQAAETPASPIANDAPEANETTKAAQVSVLLRSLRLRLRQVQQQSAEMKAVAVQTATTVAEEHRALQEELRLRQELAQSLLVREQLTAGIQHAATGPTAGVVQVDILSPASPGQQVEPQALLHVGAGGALGLITGIVLACLLLATSIGANPQDEIPVTGP